MKKQDFLFVFVLIVIFLPFFVSDAVYGWYKSFNATHGMVMSFLKFGVLATLGEMLGLRISAGVYNSTFPCGCMGYFRDGNQYGDDCLF